MERTTDPGMEELIQEATELLKHLGKDIQISLRLKQDRDYLEKDVTSLISRENALKKSLQNLEGQMKSLGIEKRSPPPASMADEFNEDLKQLFGTLSEEVKMTKNLRAERDKLKREIEQLEQKKTILEG